MDNLSDLFGGDAFSSGNVLNNLSQQVQELSTSLTDHSASSGIGQDQGFGVEHGGHSGLFAADGGLMGSHLGTNHNGMPQMTDSHWTNPTQIEHLPGHLSTAMDTNHHGMPQVTDADWANLTHVGDGSGALGGMPAHGAGLMETGHHGVSQVTESDWDKFTNVIGNHGSHGGHLTPPVAELTPNMGNNPFDRHFGSDPVSSVPKIDDMSMNKWGWVYKGDDRIGEIKDGNVYDSHGHYAGYFKVGGEVYTPEGNLLGQVSPNGDEYDPEGHKIGHIEGQYAIPKGAADMLLMRVPQQWS